MISFCVSDPKSSLLSWATQFKCNRSMPNAEDGTSIELCNGWPPEISNRSTKKTNNHRLWISNMTNGNDHHSENSKNGCCLRVTWLWWYMQSNLVAPRTWMGGGGRVRWRECAGEHWHPANTHKYTTQISTNDYFPRDSTTKWIRAQWKKTTPKKGKKAIVRHGQIKWNEHKVCEYLTLLHWILDHMIGAHTHRHILTMNVWEWIWYSPWLHYNLEAKW